MTEQETAVFLLSCTNYWANLMRGKDPDEMTKAWATALKDVPLQAAKSGAANLAATLKFPPTVAELRTAAEKFLPHKIESFDVLFARTCHECLHFDTPLYQKIQRDEVNTQEALKLHAKV